MLQNINIQVGNMPIRSGRTDEDIKALIDFNGRLMRALEYSLELLDEAEDKTQNRLETLEKELKKLKDEIEKG